MGTTSIIQIYGSIAPSLNYAMRDKTEHFEGKEVAPFIKYIIDEEAGEITYYTLTTMHNCCNILKPEKDFHYYEKKYGWSEMKCGNKLSKTGEPVVGHHILQTFKGVLDPRIVNEIGRKLVEEMFGNHVAIISTHTNTSHSHNHIIVCAWNLDGGKWNDDHESYQKIRRCSDRLCEEYGLPVLEKTRIQKLIRWTDRNGKTRYYEKTERGEKLREERRRDANNHFAINSYLNSKTYKSKCLQRDTDERFVKEALFGSLLQAKSYEHLIELLGYEGVSVEDKNENGEYINNISFKHVCAKNKVKASSIDKELEYFSREGLIATIKEQNEIAAKKQKEKELSRYSSAEIRALNSEEKMKYDAKEGFVMVPRTEWESRFVCNAKEKNEEIFRTFNVERQRELIRQIRENLYSLHFIERTKCACVYHVQRYADEIKNQISSQKNPAQKLYDELEAAQKCIITMQRIQHEAEEKEKKRKEEQLRIAREVREKAEREAYNHENQNENIWNDDRGLPMDEWKKAIKAERERQEKGQVSKPIATKKHDEWER